MSDKIEIIDIDEGPHPSTANNSRLFNLLAQDFSNDEDEDIICLDTVFKPAPKANDDNLNLMQPNNLENNPQIPSNVTNELALNKTKSPSKADHMHCFSSDEETIDDNLVQIPPCQDASQRKIQNDTQALHIKKKLNGPSHVNSVPKKIKTSNNPNIDSFKGVTSADVAQRNPQDTLLLKTKKQKNMGVRLSTKIIQTRFLDDHEVNPNVR